MLINIQESEQFTLIKNNPCKTSFKYSNKYNETHFKCKPSVNS